MTSTFDPHALATLDETEILGIIDLLVEERAIGDLDAIGSATVPKNIKKAARKAAYKLRSAGISIDAAPESAKGGLKLTEAASLEGVVLVGAPGLTAKYWLMGAELPGAAPIAFEGGRGADSARVSLLRSLSAAKLNRYQREMDGEDLPGKPILASADLGVRMIEHFATAVRADSGAFPEGWSQVLWWGDRARELGADPDRANARSTLADSLAKLAEQDTDTVAAATETLLSEMTAGPHVPGPSVVTTLLSQVAEVAEAEGDLDKDDLTERLGGLCDLACDQHFARPEIQTSSARALEATADVLYAAGASDGAAHCLWLADQLSTGARLPHELGLLRASFRRLIDYEAAWQHRQNKLSPAPESAPESA